MPNTDQSCWQKWAKIDEAVERLRYMNIDGKPYRTIWLNDDGWSVSIIAQTKLPFSFEIVELKSLEDAARAIKTMQVRGAPLIGATAAYGLALGLRDDHSDNWIDDASEILNSTRPTAADGPRCSSWWSRRRRSRDAPGAPVTRAPAACATPLEARGRPARTPRGAAPPPPAPTRSAGRAIPAGPLAR